MKGIKHFLFCYLLGLSIMGYGQKVNDETFLNESIRYTESVMSLYEKLQSAETFIKFGSKQAIGEFIISKATEKLISSDEEILDSIVSLIEVKLSNSVFTNNKVILYDPQKLISLDVHLRRLTTSTLVENYFLKREDLGNAKIIFNDLKSVHWVIDNLISKISQIDNIYLSLAIIIRPFDITTTNVPQIMQRSNNLYLVKGKLKTLKETCDAKLKELQKIVDEGGKEILADKTFAEKWLKAEGLNLNKQLFVYDSIQIVISKSQSEINSISSTKSNLEKVNTVLLLLISANKSKIQELNSSIQQNNNTINSLSKELNNKIEDRKGLIGILNMCAQLGFCNNNINAVPGKIAKLNIEIESINNQVKNLQNQNNDLSSQRNNLVSANNDGNTKVKDQNQIIIQSIADLDLLQKEIGSCNKLLKTFPESNFLLSLRQECNNQILLL